MAETKQVILVRSDLKMPKGKAVAQGAHASLQALLSQSTREGLTLNIQLRPDQLEWVQGSYPKSGPKLSCRTTMTKLSGLGFQRPSSETRGGRASRSRPSSVLQLDLQTVTSSIPSPTTSSCTRR